MKNWFLLILFVGMFLGIQLFLLENNSSQNRLNFNEVIESIIEIETEDLSGKKSFGSGVIISKDGYIITAYHLVKNSRQITIKFLGKKHKASLIGFDVYSDVAVLKTALRELNPIKFPDNFEINVGDIVYAVGNPFDLGVSVSKGILSATGRNFGNPYLDVIQTDASINQGNSGGALLNSQGEFLGLSTSIASNSGGSDGVGFALPAEKVIQISQDLIKYGEVQRAWIGNFRFRQISFQNIAGQINPGLLVYGNDDSVEGLKDGDLIIKIKNSPALWRTFIASINSISPEETIQLVVIRDDLEKTLNIKTKQRPRF